MELELVLVECGAGGREVLFRANTISADLYQHLKELVLFVELDHLGDDVVTLGFVGCNVAERSLENSTNVWVPVIQYVRYAHLPGAFQDQFYYNHTRDRIRF